MLILGFGRGSLSGDVCGWREIKMASVLSAKLVCFSGCWGMAGVLLSTCRKLPPGVYTTALFVGEGKSAATFYLVCTELFFCIKLRISGWLLCCSLELPQNFLISGASSSFSRVTAAISRYSQWVCFFFLFWTPQKNQKACLQLSLLSVKDWRWLCCSTDV